MKSPRHPMDRPNRPTDRCKGASTCTTQQPMRPAAALPRSTPSPAIGCCRPPTPDTRATTPPHDGWTLLGPNLYTHASRGCAALTRGYRVVRPLRGRQPHHQLCSGTGGASGMKAKTLFSLCIPLGLHTLASPKTGGASGMKAKTPFSLCIPLGLHYLCKKPFIRESEP